MLSFALLLGGCAVSGGGVDDPDLQPAARMPTTDGKLTLPGAGDAGLASMDGDAPEDADAVAPRLELADAQLSTDEPLVVNYMDVTKPGKPFIGLYELLSPEPLDTFDVEFGKGVDVVDGSVDFGQRQAGTYSVRLVYDDGMVADEATVRVISDRDGDGTEDGLDDCPDDGDKTAPGQCGCGSSDADLDEDGTADCVDQCPQDPNKVEPLECGCGRRESAEDSDLDGLSDCYDMCPDDPSKTEPLTCGCGVPETDGDADGTPNCADMCPDDPAKRDEGVCGCGVSDVDTDTDGTADCMDLCVQDPMKTAPGMCGCGVADSDRDADGTADCLDACPDDRRKVEPGICGCGTRDSDRDSDGALDCNEQCDADPNKTIPGVCGCGTPDTDVDSDGTLDCLDGCPTDPNKLEPLQCGCGRPDSDGDADGTPDCNDRCASDPNKTRPGQCGCGVPDTDTDGDGTANCRDECPNDPGKTVPGMCGCGELEGSCGGTVSLPVDDAFVTSEAPNQNFGNGTSLEIDADPSIKHVLIRPRHLGNIPSGATVESAQLVVEIYDAGSTVSVRELTGNWSEGTVTYSNAPGRTAQITTLRGSRRERTSTDVTAVVQRWVNGDPMYGLNLVATDWDGVDMYSSEHGKASERPHFVVTWRK